MFIYTLNWHLHRVPQAKRLLITNIFDITNSCQGTLGSHASILKGTSEEPS